MKKLLIFLLIVLLAPISLLCCKSQNQPTHNAVRAVWWWKDDLDSETIDKYLNFSESNGINQIYYSSSEFGENTETFIKKANKKGISVFWLDGNYQWLTDENKKSILLQKIENYHNYNATHPNAKFAGIHLDIEPHQDDNFESSRETLIYKLISLADELKKDNTGTHFSYDIPFWLHDEITYDNVSKPAYAHLIDIADSVVIMSYRDSASKIISVAEEELSYATSTGKTISLSVECGDHGDTVSFYEEGKENLNKIAKMHFKNTEKV